MTSDSPLPERLRKPHSHFVDESAAEYIEELEKSMCVQRIAEVVSEYLVTVNEEHANDEGIMFIPPTAIPWLAGGIAKRIVERRKGEAT